MTSSSLTVISLSAMGLLLADPQHWKSYLEAADALRGQLTPTEAVAKCQHARDAARRSQATLFDIEAIGLHCAGSLAESGRLDESEHLLNEILTARQGRTGHNSIETAVAKYHLGYLRLTRGDSASALELFRPAVQIFTREFGPAHPSAVSAKAHFAEALVARGEASRGEAILRSVIEATEASSPRQIDYMNYLASALGRQKKLAEAASQLDRALTLSVRIHGETHAKTGTIVNSAGQIALLRGQFDKAAQLLKQAQTIAETHYGPDHPTLSTILAPLGYAHFRTGRAIEAEKELKRALQLATTYLPDGHAETQATAHMLSEVLQARGAKRESKQVLARHASKAGNDKARPADLIVSFAELRAR